MKTAILTLMIVLGSAFTALSFPSSAFAAGCSNDFFGLPAWYRGLTKADSCELKKISDKGEGEITIQAFIWTIVANVADVLFRIIGIAAVGFLIYGGFQFMFVATTPEMLANAKRTITNAVIGLVISVLASVIVGLIMGIFNKG